MKIIECVPNFSEGRDLKVIDKIAQSIRDTPGCTVLDVDPGVSTNRTVLTFVGDPESVVFGAFNAAKAAFELIDMRKHCGEHSRMGAMDVCPFVPVRNSTMEDCVSCAQRFGAMVGKELGLPIFLYEDAALAVHHGEHRIQLKQIREGQYEGLAEKIVKPEWKPDFGPSQFIPSYGATVTGARFFLLAYNINVLGTKEQSHRIALNLREAGRGPDQPGRLPKTKAVGWYVDEYNLAQISMNVDDYRVSPFHLCYEEAVKDGKELNVAIAGSELVGLIPLDAMLRAADYYIQKENLFILDERQKIRLVVERLGLGSVAPFDPDKKIIEYMVQKMNEGKGNQSKLIDVPLKSLILNEFGARKGAPGGGSAAAVIAALGASLGTMVGLLSFGIRRFEHLDSHMRTAIPPLYDVMHQLVPLVDLDTEAYLGIIKVVRLTPDTPENKKMIEDAYLKAIEVPLHIMRTSDKAWDAMLQLAHHCNINSQSDLEVGAKSLETGIFGSHRNVLINIKGSKEILPKEKLDALAKEAQVIMNRAYTMCQDVLNILDSRQ